MIKWKSVFPLLSLLYFATYCLYAQNSIQGKVIDNESNFPIAGVIISTYPPNKTTPYSYTITNSEGYFQLDAQPDFDIHFKKIGYQFVKIKVDELKKTIRLRQKSNEIIQLEEGREIKKIFWFKHKER